MKKYELTKEEYEKVKHLLEEKDRKFEAVEDLVGGIVFIRTVTHYYTGRLVKISGNFMVLEDTAWIGDTGRFADFMKGTPNGNLEVEPMGKTMVNLDSVIDISPYQTLFLEQK